DPLGRRVSTPLLDRDGAAEPDLVTVPEPVTVAERRRMIAEVLKVLPRRYPAAAHLGVAQPRQQLAENRRQDEAEEAADLEISVLVEIADVNDPLALGGDAVEHLIRHGSHPRARFPNERSVIFRLISRVNARALQYPSVRWNDRSFKEGRTCDHPTF